MLSIILPCFHPPKNWADNVITAIDHFTNVVKTDFELIIVVDGDTAQVPNEGKEEIKKGLKNVKIIEYTENRGKGYALRQGVKEASGDLIMYTDIDIPYTMQSMVDIFNTLTIDGFDVAIGVKDASYYSHLPVARKLVSKGLQFVSRIFLSMPITDTQCGLKGFKKNVKQLFLKTQIDRYLFDLEFVKYCFEAKNLKIKAVPIILTNNVHFRNLNNQVIKEELFNFIKILFKKKK